ncbi:MAG: glycosyltransferase family 4 protein [candidate division Zixibacteria bacterium]|nr:glycosyltransferase family 4 protein [candidate division Zixibacteria bacterium]
MRRYKILFLNSIRENVWGGGENLIYNYSAHLTKRGHKIYIAGRKNSEFLSHFSPEKVNLIPLKIRGDFDPVNIFFLARLMSREKIDFLWVNFNKDLRLGGIASRIIRGLKIIWGMGVLLPETSLVHRLTGKFLPDKIVVPSQNLKDQLGRFPWLKPDKIEVITNGIDLSLFNYDLIKEREKLFHRYNLDPKLTLIGVSARLVKAKGHRYLLQALPEIIKVHPDIKLFIAGDGSEKEHLIELSRKLNLDDYVIFAGYIKEIFETMAGFDLLVLPSIIEPFGLVLAEGMALKKPIVATRVGGIPEVIQDQKTGILVLPEDPHSLASAIITLLKDRNLATRLGEKGRERVEKLFTIEKMINRIEELLDEMYQQKRL